MVGAAFVFGVGNLGDDFFRSVLMGDGVAEPELFSARTDATNRVAGVVPVALLSTLAVAGILLVVGLIVGAGLAVLMGRRDPR